MMFLWSVGGCFLGYLSYIYTPYASFLRSKPSFNMIRNTLTLLPIMFSTFYGTKFMVIYKRKGVR